jgi:hypothetical protein
MRMYAVSVLAESNGVFLFSYDPNIKERELDNA